MVFVDTWRKYSVPVWHCGQTGFLKKFKIFFFFFFKIECSLYFLDYFDVLMSKIIFKK